MFPARPSQGSDAALLGIILFKQMVDLFAYSTPYPFFIPAFSMSFICCSDIDGISGWASLA